MPVFSVLIILMSTRNTENIAWSALKIFNYLFVVSANNSLMNAMLRDEIGLRMLFSHGVLGFKMLLDSFITEFL
jgi:hypothetical protein